MKCGKPVDREVRRKCSPDRYWLVRFRPRGWSSENPEGPRSNAQHLSIAKQENTTPNAKIASDQNDGDCSTLTCPPSTPTNPVAPCSFTRENAFQCSQVRSKSRLLRKRAVRPKPALDMARVPPRAGRQLGAHKRSAQACSKLWDARRTSLPPS